MSSKHRQNWHYLSASILSSVVKGQVSDVKKKKSKENYSFSQLEGLADTLVPHVEFNTKYTTLIYGIKLKGK